mmetsp:Transcript_5398/g.12202  ORF Transcript_5398/g.12202 Transcript_5398/m.12202 type:complete len:87 (+) Transcript_5398:69-329(+)
MTAIDMDAGSRSAIRRHLPKTHVLPPGAGNRMSFNALALDIPPRTTPIRPGAWGWAGPTLEQLRAEVESMGVRDLRSARPEAAMGL